MLAYPKNARGARKQSDRTKWRKKCLRVWSKLVRERDGHTCQKCWNAGRVEAHHIIARGTWPKPGDLDLNNGVTLCANCHKFRGAHSPSWDDQQAFNLWIRGWLKSRGLVYDNMAVIYRARARMSIEDMKLWLATTSSTNRK